MAVASRVRSSVVIRRLKQDDDLRGLIVLSREFFAEYASHHRELFAIGRLHDRHITDYFSRFVGRKDAAAFVALDCGTVVGYVTVVVRAQPPFNRVRSVGAVSGLMVARAYRRRGVAATLMAEVTSFLRKRRVRYFTATTAVANKTAIKFYERNGMEPLQVTMAGTAHGRDRTRKSTGSYRKARE